MMPLKPYAWLYEPSSGSKILFVRINCTSGTLNYNLPSALVDITPSGSSTMILVCDLSSGGGGGEQSIQYTISGSTSYTKVRVIVRVGSTEKGNISLRLNANHFTPTIVKPHCWIKLKAVTDTEVFFWLQPPSSSSLSGPTVVTDASAHKLTLQYTITAGTETYFERSFPLDAYDPTTYEYIEVTISQSGSLKGKGTTSQTDADSSGDD